MSYNVKTIFPKEESIEKNTQKYVTTSRQELASEKELDEVLSLYNDYQRQGFNVSVGFKPPVDTDEGEEPVSVFEVAEQLTLAGIDYKATLKLKFSGSYDDMLHVARSVEQQGYDYVVDAKLKINEDSVINIDKINTWSAEDAVYKVTPKASSDDINELRGLYDVLSENDYDVTIDIKPKKQSTDEDDFGTQLAAYPDGTELTFTLKDSEY